jgi:hypothetical protein
VDEPESTEAQKAIETVDISKNFPIGLNTTTFNIIKQNTRAAGRGEVLSYEQVDLRGEAVRKAAAEAAATQSLREYENSTAGRTARIFKNDL